MSGFLRWGCRINAKLFCLWIVIYLRKGKNNIYTSGRGRLWWPALGVVKTLHTDNKQHKENMKTLAMFCVYDANTSVFILGTVFWSATALYCRKKLENLPKTSRQADKQTNTQTDREFKYRDHSYPLWIVGESGPTCDSIILWPKRQWFQAAIYRTWIEYQSVIVTYLILIT